MRRFRTTNSLLVGCFCAVVFSAWGAGGRQASVGEADPAIAREKIQRLYAEWGKARVAFDRETIERQLALDFYVLLDGERISRERFVEMVTKPGRARLTRFDVEVLTVQRSKDGWTAVITEKLEYELPDRDQKAYAYWVTRDGFRAEGDHWLATSSEAIGYETWRSGSKPPIEGW